MKSDIFFGCYILGHFLSFQVSVVTKQQQQQRKVQQRNIPNNFNTPKKETEVKLTFFSFYFESNIFFPTKQRALIQTETGELCFRELQQETKLRKTRGSRSIKMTIKTLWIKRQIQKKVSSKKCVKKRQSSCGANRTSINLLVLLV